MSPCIQLSPFLHYIPCCLYKAVTTRYFSWCHELPCFFSPLISKPKPLSKVMQVRVSLMRAFKSVGIVTVKLLFRAASLFFINNPTNEIPFHHHPRLDFNYHAAIIICWAGIHSKNYKTHCVTSM